MPRLDDAPIVTGGAMADAYAAPTAVEVAQEQALQDKALTGPFTQGLRSGWAGVTGQAHSLAGTIAENMGLTEFAQSRFNEADLYANQAEAAAPDVRDYRAAKDLRSASVYVLGQAGQAVATMGPTVATALLTRGRAVPTFGVAGGMMAGEQDVNIRRESPHVSAADRLGSDVAQGAVGGVLEAAVPLSLARRAAKGTLGRISNTMIGEAATEAGQTITGQQLHSSVDPLRNTSEDQAEIINAAIGGAIGGGGAHIASSLPNAGAAGIEKAKEYAPKAREVFDGTLDSAKKLLAKTPSVEDLKGITLPDEVKDVESAVNFVMDSEKTVREAATKAADWVAAQSRTPEGLKQAMRATSEKLKDPMLDPDKLTELADKAKVAIEKLEVDKKIETATAKMKEYVADAKTGAKEILAGFDQGVAAQKYDARSMSQAAGNYNFDDLPTTPPKKSRFNMRPGPRDLYSESPLGAVGPKPDVGEQRTQQEVDPRATLLAPGAVEGLRGIREVGRSERPVERALPADIEGVEPSQGQLQALVDKFKRRAASSEDPTGREMDFEVMDIMTNHMDPVFVGHADADLLVSFSEAQQEYVRHIVQKTVERRTQAIKTGEIQNDPDVAPLPFRPDKELVALYGSPKKAKAALTEIARHMFKRGDWKDIGAAPEDMDEVPRFDRSLRQQATYGKAVELAVARQLYPQFIKTWDVRAHVAQQVGERVSDWMRDPHAGSAAELVDDIKRFVKDPEGLMDEIFALSEQRRSFVRGAQLLDESGNEIDLETGAPRDETRGGDLAPMEQIGRVGDVAGGPSGDRSGFGLPQRREPSDAELRLHKQIKTAIGKWFDTAVTAGSEEGKGASAPAYVVEPIENLMEQDGLADLNPEHAQFIEDTPAQLEQLFNIELSVSDKRKQARERADALLEVLQGRGVEWYALSITKRYNSGQFIVNLNVGTKRVDTQRLFNAMNRRYKGEYDATERAGQTAKKYVSDMFSRGISHLVSDERVRQNAPLPDKAFDWKDDEVLVTHNGTKYTWGDIKEGESEQGGDETLFTVTEGGNRVSSATKLGTVDDPAIRAPRTKGMEKITDISYDDYGNARVQSQATDAARVVQDPGSTFAGRAPGLRVIMPEDNTDAGYIADEAMLDALEIDHDQFVASEAHKDKLRTILGKYHTERARIHAGRKSGEITKADATDQYREISVAERRDLEALPREEAMATQRSTPLAATMPSGVDQRRAMKFERQAPFIKVTREQKAAQKKAEEERAAAGTKTQAAQRERALEPSTREAVKTHAGAKNADPETVTRLAEDVVEARKATSKRSKERDSFEEAMAEHRDVGTSAQAAAASNWLLNSGKLDEAGKKRLVGLMSKRNWMGVLNYAAEYVDPKNTKMRVDGTNKLHPDAQAKIREEIERILGKKDTDVMFKELEDMDGAQGRFIDLDPIERIEIGLMTGAPMATAYHEVAHAFFTRLAKSHTPMAKRAMNDLLEFSATPRTRAQLEKLIREHASKDTVDDTLKQLDDPEERIAFAFQMWRQGKLEVGPRTDGWFNRVRNWLAKVFNIVPRDQRIADYFDALYRGRFANKDMLAEVLVDVRRTDAFDQADASMPHVMAWMNKAFSTADGWIRDQKIPALTEIADKMSLGTGAQNKAPGFMQAKHVELNKRMNRLMATVRGKSKEQMRLAIDALQKQSGVAPQDEGAKAIYNSVREILDEAHQYVTKAGVKQYTGRNDKGDPQYSSIKFLKNYFPQMWDHEAIRADKAGFEKMLESAGMKPDAIKLVYDFFTQMNGNSTTLGKNDITGTLQFRFDAANERILNDLDKDLAQKYMQKDLIYAMSSYLNQAVKRAEWSRRFEDGEGNSTIPANLAKAKEQGMSDETAKDMTRYLQAMEGTLGHDIPQELRNLFGGLTVYQNVRLLPFTLMSSLVDPMGIVVRGGTLGDAFQAYVKGVKSLFGKSADEDYELASTIGAIEEGSAMALYGDLYGSQYMTPWQRRVNSLFFKWNGMEAWNRSMRVASSRAAVRFLDRHAAGHNQHSARYLKELNVTPEDVRARNEKWEQAVNSWVDQSVLRPNASQRPIWMSDPHWQLVSHLKQFTYSFQKVILDRVFHELKHGNSSPLIALSSYVPLMIASDVMRQFLTLGTEEPDKDLSEWMLQGVQRAGLLGPAQFIVDAYGDAKHGKMGAEGLFGPSAEQLADFARSTSAKGSVTDWLVRAGPINAIYR